MKNGTFLKNGKVLDIIDTKQSKMGHFVRKPGEGVPPHKTENREEVIIVLRGNMTLYANKKTYQVAAGNYVYIPPGVLHEVKNCEKDDLEYVYFVSMLS